MPRRSSRLLWTLHAGALLVAGLLAGLGPRDAAAQVSASACGALGNPYGPYDYRTDRDKLDIVEGAHFTAIIEAGAQYLRPRAIADDIDYTLRAFPNHHRALVAMVRQGERLKSAKPEGARWPVECYFDRAIRFRPDDMLVHMLYAQYLTKNQRGPEATRQLEIATAGAGDSSFTHYNIGLLYYELKNYDRALVQAHKAYGLGIGFPALRDQLKSVGKWVDAPAEVPAEVPAKSPAETPAAAASSAASAPG